jgi:hypothetical protein
VRDLRVLFRQFFSHNLIILFHQDMFINNLKVPFLNLVTKEHLFLDQLSTVYFLSKVGRPQSDALGNFTVISQFKNVRLVMVDVKGVAEVNVVVDSLVDGWWGLFAWFLCQRLLALLLFEKCLFVILHLAPYVLPNAHAFLHHLSSFAFLSLS